MQPASHRGFHTRTDSAYTLRTTGTATNIAPSRHHHWHCTASIVRQTLLPRDDQPTAALHLSIPPLHRQRQQLHCPAHKCNLGNAATLSCDVPKAVHELSRKIGVFQCMCMILASSQWPDLSTCIQTSRGVLERQLQTLARATPPDGSAAAGPQAWC